MIDDDYASNAALSRFLETAGFRVVGRAYDGNAGLELVKLANADVALVDIQMPGIDGFELARRTKELDRRPRLVAISGTDHMYNGKFEAAGFDAHFPKPVNLDVLASLLTQFASG